MSLPRASSLLLLLSLALAACGTSGGTGPASTATLTRFCTNNCGWRDRCGRPSSSCISECQRDLATFASRVRERYLSGAAACFETLACTSNDDTCMANYPAVDSAFPNIPVVQSCLSKRTGCSNAWSDDYCYGLTALIDSYRAQADACWSRPCDEIQACLRTTLGTAPSRPAE